MADSFPCPACGFLTFSEPPGSYALCDVCGWEDDHVQLTHPRMQGGANSESLVEAQREALKTFPPDQQVHDGYRRDPDWRPLTDDETGIRPDAPRWATDYFSAAIGDAPPYYWRKRP